MYILHFYYVLHSENMIVSVRLLCFYFGGSKSFLGVKLKVSKSQKQIIMSLILPKNELIALRILRII